MTIEELSLLNKLNFVNRQWGIVTKQVIDTKEYFETPFKEKIKGPIIYCYIDENMKCDYAEIAANTIGSDKFMIIKVKHTKKVIAIYQIEKTDE